MSEVHIRRRMASPCDRKAITQGEGKYFVKNDPSASCIESVHRA